MKKPLSPRLLLSALLVVACAPFAVAQKPDTPLYLDPAQPLPARIHDLVSRMTLEEKASMMQNTTPGVPRLGIPRYDWWSEGLHGVANAGFATVFPQAIGLAAMWDAPLQERIGHVVGVEGRAKYNGYGPDLRGTRFHGLTFWSPNVNIFRDPRWGRGQETYGEDPFLTSQLGVAFVRGIQGDNPRYLLAGACAKHFAVHSGPEPLRHGFNVDPVKADLYETYFPAFEALVRRAHVEVVMTAYNSLYGTPCSINPLLYGSLKDWGFDGQVTSDCGSVDDLVYSYKRAKNQAQAQAMVLKAGMDVTCGAASQGIVKAVQEGLLPEAVVNERVSALLRTMFRLGFFDPKGMDPYASIKPSENDTPAHAALALHAAREAIVLLKNDGVLPLQVAKYPRIAVIGPNASSVPALVGNYNGTPSAPVTVLAGIRAALGSAAQVDYAHGCDYADLRVAVRPVATGWFHGEYFSNPTLSGSPIATRSDRPIFLDGTAATDHEGRALPDGVPGRGISVRWTGNLQTNLGGAYGLTVRVRGGVRLMVDGKTVIDSWTPAPRQSGEERVVTVTRDLPENASLPFTLEYVQGAGPAKIEFEWSSPPAESGEAQALTVAKAADLIVYVGGISAELEGEEMSVPYVGFKGGDRETIELPAVQRALLRKLVALGKPVVYVNLSGSAVAMPWAAEHVDALVQAWYPGEAGGTAVADVLLGKVNPSGRLPVTFYRSTKDLPPFTDYAMAGRTYRYFHGKPLFPFGFGLSYTHFTYSNLHVVREPGDALSVSVDVTNSGDRDGDEVVQLYATPPAASHPRESEALCGFARVHLARGETKTVTIAVPATALRRWDDKANAYAIPSGAWTLRAAASSADIRLTTKVEL
ncbi:xylan 1,4-beta-xylosidase precursor [mine drainage metagenome]|uniref:Xylan 1,4-beta-xylosidase n=1 Tax=mine drainage metagenome TaxID=410659 RepID=A0A1J5R565_9ZZZZ